MAHLASSINEADHAVPPLALAALPTISRRDAACHRLDGIETLAVDASGERMLTVALPESYDKRPRARFALALLLDPGDCFGAATELARLMAGTGEIDGVIVAALHVDAGDDPAALHVDAGDDPAALGERLLREVLPACAARYRLAAGRTLLCDLATRGHALLPMLCHGPGDIRHFAIADPDAEWLRTQVRRASAAPGRPRRLVLGAAESPASAGALAQLADDLAVSYGAELQVSSFTYPRLSASGAAIPTLGSALFAFHATGRAYGALLTPLRRPWLSRTLQLLKPLFARLVKPPPRSDSPYVVRSQAMGRDYEVFVTLPDSWRAGGTQRYPLLFVLDANIELSIVAETAARLARAGEIAELVIVGIGTPRSEGHTEFAFRRFEELFPPHGAVLPDDDLGRIMRALYATRGKDAHDALGHAPQLYRFLVDELLPQLRQTLPVAADDIGIIGHSAAGAFVGYAMYQAGTPFRRCIAISPGVGISGSWLMRAPATVSRGTSLYVALGSAERSNLFNRIAGIPLSEAWAARVAAQPGTVVQTQCFDGETHSSVFPLATAAGLLALYSPTAHGASDSETGRAA